MRRTAFSILLPALALSLGCGGSRQQERDMRAMTDAPERSEQRAPSPNSVAPDNSPVIVTFGDSLTAGLGVDPRRNYPARLEQKINAEGYRYRVINAGISGETSAQGLDRLQSVRALRPAVVIVEFGANDGLRGIPVDTVRENLEAIVSGLQEDGIQVVLAGMQMPPNYGPVYTNAFAKVFSETASKNHVPLIPFFLEGVGGNPQLNQSDGIHPTEEGYAIVADNVWRVLKPVLKR